MRVAEDWELVARARAGNQDAFAQLVRRYQQPVTHFCYRMTGSLEDAEDVAQECFLRVYRYLERLEPKASFSTVVFGMARNLTLNYLRNEQRRGRGRSQSQDAQPLPAAANGQPAQTAQRNETAALIENAIAELSPNHREVIVLREINGLDYDAIAGVLRCSLGTVRSRLARAREQLRLRLEASGAFES